MRYVVVVQFAKLLTTKGTKVHEGKHLRPKAFVPLVVQDFVGSVVKLHHYPLRCAVEKFKVKIEGKGSGRGRPLHTLHTMESASTRV